jgi:hypothetical protein
MLLWSFSVFLLLLALRTLFFGTFWSPALPGSPGLLDWLLQGGREKEELKRVDWTLLELAETLESGLVPEPERWEKLARLPEPWGPLASASLLELRKKGAAVLPTLRRLRELAREHLASLRATRARTAQALTQVLVCALLVPLVGFFMALLLPGVAENGLAWILGCVLALVVAGSGAIWMFLIAEDARWGGLAPGRRPWILGALCAGERFLAGLRCGCPADEAWVEACRFLSEQVDGLASRWGHSVWEEQRDSGSERGLSLVLVDAGKSLRRSIHASLMEGKPCSERIETFLRALREDINGTIELEIEKVGTRVLRPLFGCVAPALFGLLGFAFYISWTTHGLG